jgi:deoxyribodipyrimidine photo-lyase
MLEGLEEVREALRRRGIRFVLLRRSPELAAAELSREAALLVTDRGYLRIQRFWRTRVATTAPCAVIQVESDAVVPVEAASPKEEYSAGTLRPKLRRILPDHMLRLKDRRVRKDSLALSLDVECEEDYRALLNGLQIDRSVLPVNSIHGGTAQASALLDEFIGKKAGRYADLRNHPGLDHTSGLSPYLHFGQISPLAIALRISGEASLPVAARDAFLEELIVRRELSLNFVLYNERYDEYDSLPAWARKTLAGHRKDHREYLFDPARFEIAATHDPCWNAAQDEMLLTGKMHPYMRMYWGKKILEWSPTPEEAYRTALSLNNKYELDGRDPNGFAGVAWCFGKHDRPWPERKIYGMVRTMNEAGLRRKFDMETYLRKVAALKREP